MENDYRATIGWVALAGVGAMVICLISWSASGEKSMGLAAAGFGALALVAWLCWLVCRSVETGQKAILRELRDLDRKPADSSRPSA